MNNLLLRSLTGSLFVAAIIGAILWNDRASAAVFGIFMLLGVHEFNGLIRQHTPYKPQRGFALAIALLIFAAFVANFEGWLKEPGLFLLMPIVAISYIISLFGKSETPLQNVAMTFFSWIYVVVPFVLITNMSYAESNEWEIVGMFVLIWTNDTMAYVTGRLLGRTKLFERISPKKTWEGTIGGIVFTLGAGFCWATWMSELPLSFWLIAAPLVAMGAIFGDLFESQIKRQLGVKDSGNILPGHGGILDRFDAALLAIPIFYGLWSIYH